MVFGCLTQVAFAAGESYTTFHLYDDGNYTRVCTTSDVHLEERTENRIKFAALLKAMKADYDPDMLLICGDNYTSNYTPPASSSYPDPIPNITSVTNPYDEIRAVVKYYLGDNFPLVIIPGNHDGYKGLSYFTDYSGFSSYYGLVPTANFDVFMFGSQPTSGMAEAPFSDAQITALTDYLNNRTDKTKPVIVMSHYPLDDSNGHQPPANAGTVKNLLTNSGQPIIFLWGHNHNESVRDPGADFASLSKPYGDHALTINAGAVGYRTSPYIYAQGLEISFDFPGREATFHMRRINTTAGTSAEVGSLTLDLGGGSSSSEVDTPSITAQPGDVTARIGKTAAVSVTATARNGSLSYQWYSNTADSNEGGSPVDGATGRIFSAPTGAIGVYYYYCVVTNTLGDQTAAATSEAAAVTVTDVHFSSGWDGGIADSFGGGSGNTPEDPYLISNGDELAYLARQVNGGEDYSGKYFRQTADIDLNSLDWTPIGEYRSSQGGAVNYPFAGTYDGDGYIVSNLYAHQSFSGTIEKNKSLGLFGYMTGTVINAGVTNVDISVTNTNTGSDAGTFNAYAGGITGYLSADDSKGIFNSFAEGVISANTTSSSARCAAGGIAGYSYTSGGTIANSYSAVAVTIGGTYGSSTNAGAGGLVGYLENGSISNSYWNTALTAEATNGGSASGAAGKTTAEMQAPAFADLLNAHRDSYKAWMADLPGLNAGYPIHERVVVNDDAQAPQITVQPADISVGTGETALLSLTAHVASGELSYQWYRTATRTTTGGTAVGENSPSYSAPTDASGTSYYYCLITNTDTSAPGAQTATAKSASAKVAVREANVWDGSAKTAIALGSGTEADPYQVWTGADLAWIADQVNSNSSTNVFEGKYFKQMADIDLGSHTWTPIGKYFASSSSDDRRAFCGTYDGDGHIISNLSNTTTITYNDSDTKAFGLFGLLYGTVKNLGVVGATVTVTNSSNSSSAILYAGGIAGYAGSGGGTSGYIYNSYVTGTISATTNNSSAICCAGGLCGNLAYGTFTNSYGAARVTIEGSHAGTGSSGTSGAGGVSGRRASSNATFTNCYWDSTLTSYPMNSSTTTVSGAAGYNTTACTTGGTLLTQLHDKRGSYVDWIADIGINGGYPIHKRAVSHENAETPNITDQPDDVSAYLHSPATLRIDAFVSQGALSYQWYRNTTKSNAGGTKINGATGTSYAASTAASGSAYYYCVVTNFDSYATVNRSASIASNAVEVAVDGTPAAWDGTAKTAIALGSGTEADPYQVWTGADLAWIADQVNSNSSTNVFENKYFKQMADIDLGSHTWTPIGKYFASSSSDDRRAFCGTYDGNGHIISNLSNATTITYNDSNTKAFGLFGLSYGTIKNLGVVNVSLAVTNSSNSSSAILYAGGIVGYAGSGGGSTCNIYNSYVTGAISATTNHSSAVCCAGGLSGNLAYGAFTNSYGAARVTIEGSHAGTGSSGTSGAGGVSGRRASSNATFTNCYWDSTLTSYPMNSSSTTVSGATGRTTAQCQDGTLLTALQNNHGSYLNWIADTGINGGYPIHIRTVVTDAPAPTIGTQPVGGAVAQNEPAMLTVAATGSGALYYQWYSNTAAVTGGSTEIPLATSSSYSPPTGAAGTVYYYCVVTNYDDKATGCQYAETASDIVGITVHAATTDAEAPAVSGPADTSVIEGETAQLTVSATGTGALSYQWYTNSAESYTGGTLLSETSDTLNLPTTGPGTVYVYCVVTNYDSSATGNQYASANSWIATVTISAKTLQSIALKDPPAKTSYIEGQSFDPSGLTLTAAYDNGDTATIASGFTYDAADPLPLGESTVTVSYGGKTTTFKVNAAAKSLTGIAVKDPPAKTSYIEGQSFDPSGLTLTAAYDNGDTATIASGFTYDAADPLPLGESTVTVKFGGKETTFKVNAVAKSLNYIAITCAPDDTDYIEGQRFDPLGMLVTAYYDNGKHEEATGYLWSPDGELTTSNKQVTIQYTYKGITKTATQNITVVAKSLTSISIAAPPAKTSYVEGDAFNAAGMVVTAYYDNGKHRDVAGYAWSPNGALATTDAKITVSYAENGVTKTATQAITVIPKGTLRLIVKDTNDNIYPGVSLAVYADEGKTVLVGSGVSAEGTGLVTITGLGTATYWVTITGVPEGYTVPDVTIPENAVVGQTKEYIIKIAKTKVYAYNSSQLMAIDASAGTLSPNFNPEVLNYTLTLNEYTGSTTVRPTLADSSSKLYINGSRVASKTVMLNPGGKYALKIRVLTKAGKSQYYNVTVVRAKSTNAYLAGLTASKGALSPAFNKDTGSYSIELTNVQSSVSFTPKLADKYAKYSLTVGGKRTSSKTVSLKLNETKTFVVTVTAQAGNTRTYTVTIHRQVSYVNDLAGLTVSRGALSPAFNKGTDSYTLELTNVQSSVRVTPKLADKYSKYTLTVNGRRTTSTTVSLNLDETKTLVITVTAQADNTKTYTVRIHRDVSRNADLAGVSASKGTLTRDAGDPTKYTLRLANTLGSVKVTPKLADKYARYALTVGGKRSSNTVSINAGETKALLITVTAQDKKTVKVYTLTITRDISHNADLAYIKVSKGALTPAFAAGTADYTLALPSSQPSVRFTLKAADGVYGKYSVQVNGKASGTTISLQKGETKTVVITVKAQAGDTKTYTVVITRAS